MCIAKGKVRAQLRFLRSPTRDVKLQSPRTCTASYYSTVTTCPAHLMIFISFVALNCAA